MYFFLTTIIPAFILADKLFIKKKKTCQVFRLNKLIFFKSVFNYKVLKAKKFILTSGKLIKLRVFFLNLTSSIALSAIFLNKWKQEIKSPNQNS
jgi:hypothetical protein